MLCSGSYANGDNEQARLGRVLANLRAGALWGCTGPAAAVLSAGCRCGLWGGSRAAGVGMAYERRAGLEAVTGTIALVGMAVTSGRGPLGRQCCATPGRVLMPERCWATSKAGAGPDAGQKAGTRRPGHRRLLPRWAARRWCLSSCRARPPRGPRAGPSPAPGPAASHILRPPSGPRWYRNRPDARRRAAPPRAGGAAEPRCSVLAPQISCEAREAHKARAAPAPPRPSRRRKVKSPPAGGRGGEAGGGTPLAPRTARPGPAPSALHKSIGAGRSEDVTASVAPERAGDLRAEISRRGDGICLLLCSLPPPPGSAEGSGEGLGCRAWPRGGRRWRQNKGGD